MLLEARLTATAWTGSIRRNLSYWPRDLLQQRPLAAISDLANHVAAWVCSQPGATPILPDELRAFN